MPGLPPPPPPDSDEEDSDQKAIVAVSRGNARGAAAKGGKVAPAGRDFSVQPEELCSFMERAVGNKGSVEVLEREFNGIMGLAHTLRVNPALGLVRAPLRSAARCSAARCSAAALGCSLTGLRRAATNRRASRTSSRATTTLAATCMRRCGASPRRWLSRSCVAHGWWPASLTRCTVACAFRRTQAHIRGLWSSICHVMHDAATLLLVVVAIGLFAVGIVYEDSNATTEGAAVFASLVVLVLIGAWNDRDRDRKFAHLNELVNDISIGVRRNSEVVQIHTSEIVVGDIIEVAYGNMVPCDGVLVEGSDIKANEYALTGDQRDIDKNDEYPFMLAGTQMVGGYGYMMVVAVGEHTFKGNIVKLLAASEDTPTGLQHKLETAAHQTGKMGLVGMLLTIAILGLWFGLDFVLTGMNGWRDRYTSLLLEFLVNGIVLMIVAVPESLSLAVSLALAHAIKRMVKENNLLRHVDCLEKLGQATCICTDKTGTLTTNRMAVAKSWFGHKRFLQVPPLQEVGKEMVRAMGECIAVTSTATLELQRTNEFERVSVLGNKTEGALLMLARYMGIEYERVRKQLGRLHFHTFSSDRKRTSTLVNNVNSKGLKTQAKRLYVTGAAEVVLRLCEFHLNVDGISTTKLTDELRAELMDDVVGGFAHEGLRTIALAYRVIDDMYGVDWNNPSSIEHTLVLIGVVGINDPLREEVPDAISECLKSGITVRMVTGDSLDTATTIAIRSRLFRKEDGDLAMEGSDFRRRVTDSTGEIYAPEFDSIWPRLRVLARASPQDKATLVKGLREVAKQVVVATGDSTSDATALSRADIGFAMGISGTDVAKESADVLLLNDSFHSIMDAVLWGRNLVDATCKFLQFQLTTASVVVVVSVIGAALLKHPLFSPVQLLWINFVADPFGSLALATEGPSSKTLAGRQPYKDEDPLVTPYMSRDIVGQACYQVIVLLLLLFGGGLLVDMEFLSEAIDVVDRLTTDNEGLTRDECAAGGLLWHDRIAGQCMGGEGDTVVSDLHCEVNGCDFGCGFAGGVRCGTVEAAADGMYLGVEVGRTNEELRSACEVNRNVWQAPCSDFTVGDEASCVSVNGCAYTAPVSAAIDTCIDADESGDDCLTNFAAGFIVTCVAGCEYTPAVTRVLESCVPETYAVGCTAPDSVVIGVPGATPPDANFSTHATCTQTGHSWVPAVDEYCEVDSIRVLSSHKDGSAHLTLIFNVCVLMALANTLNCRKVHNEANRLQGILQHKMLVVLIVGTFLVHMLLVQSFGSVISGAKGGLSSKCWVLSLVLGLSVLGWGQLLRFIPSRFCSRFARKFNEAASAHELDEEEAREMRKKRHHFCRCHVKGGARLRKEFSQVRALPLPRPQPAPGVLWLTCVCTCVRCHRSTSINPVEPCGCKRSRSQSRASASWTWINIIMLII